MLIADTGPLVAMLNAKDKHHEACTALFRRFRGPIIVPAPIVTEVAYFLQIEPGPVVEAAFLDALARGELIVEATTTQAFARMAGLIAHALEEYPHRLRFRPRATYVGPALRA